MRLNSCLYERDLQLEIAGKIRWIYWQMVFLCPSPYPLILTGLICSHRSFSWEAYPFSLTCRHSRSHTSRFLLDGRCSGIRVCGAYPRSVCIWKAVCPKIFAASPQCFRIWCIHIRRLASLISPLNYIEIIILKR